MKNTKFIWLNLFLAVLIISGVARAEVIKGMGIKLEVLKRPQHRSSLHKPVSTFPDDLIITEGLREGPRSWFPWDPNGANAKATNAGCSKESLREIIWRNSKSTQAQGGAVNAWIERCESQFSTSTLPRSLWPLFKFATVNYDFLENPNIQAVSVTLPEGRVLSGFIALKPDKKPRPLVIGKCGAWCMAEEGATHRSYMMHLFDESPFHVLSLGSISGPDFQVDNKAFSVGGFDEGRQLYQIAQLLKSPNSPFAQVISSVHVVGTSLGAAGALYSGLYSSVNDSFDHPSIQSVTALCPVVVMENSAKRLYTARPVSAVAAFGTIHQIKDIFAFIPLLSKIFPEGWGLLRGEHLYNKVSEAIFSYYRDWTAKSAWDLKPFVGERVSTLEQFWRINDYRNFTRAVQVPTLAIAADNDDFVRVKDNAQLLSDTLQVNPNADIGTVYFKHGNHCAFSIANGWANYSTLLREYILSHSPEASAHWRAREVPLPNFTLELKQGERITKTEWQAKMKDRNMYLSLQIFSPRVFGDSEGCIYEKMYNADPRCYRQIQLPIALASLPVESTQAMPRTNFEVTSLTRFANTRFSVLDKNRKLVTDTNLAPEFVQAWEWK